ncbi:zinc finger BED domain-containing protein RICESLEEPER 4-like [Beta vulgaris subsp. vulgaris]|uniref:zinc finger BED domain-containing protein RICESLEEPER 4-like n=1 Tax=Beta vulgaris subsp. vulgaris TaxID=3555 RepID=UPI002037304F|nr:zinc finger BED domain-containing protein RICESLEEPER 4-like [Beta vulgaris subsp. vulgaris]
MSILLDVDQHMQPPAPPSRPPLIPSQSSRSRKKFSAEEHLRRQWYLSPEGSFDLRCSKKNFEVDMRQKLLKVSQKSDGTCSVDATNFNQEVSRKELANMVIMHEYPLAIVDHVDFRRFVSSLNPSFKIISRPTLRVDIMKMFTCEKAGLKKVLENSESQIAITTDIGLLQIRRKVTWL